MPPAGSLFGFEVSSDIPLRRLLPEAGPRGRLEIRRAPGPLMSNGRIVHSVETAGVTFTLRRAGERLHALCSVTGEYVIDSAGNVLAAPTDCHDDAWEHRVVSTVIPLLLAERGDLVVHGSGIEVEGRAIAFVGPTGRGKSTTAFVAAGLGYRVLAEDGLVVDLSGDEPVIWPGPLGFRLSPLHGQTMAKEIHLSPTEVHLGRPAPPAAVLLLGERADDLSITRLRPAAAVPALVPNLIYGGSDRLPEAFGLAARFCAQFPVYRCRLPGDLTALPLALDELLRKVRSGGAPVH